MARKKSGGSKIDPLAWMITFSDLITLLLTFFVLLLSMSSLDNNVLESFTLFTREVGLISEKTPGRVPTRFQMIAQILEKPWEALQQRERIKDLLLPDDAIPPDIDRSTLDENLDIIMRDNGVALVLTDNLLFPSGGYELSREAEFLLEQVAFVLMATPAPANIAGFTDTIGTDDQNYRLSALRAEAVLQYFLGLGLNPERFSVSGYGPMLPISDNDTEAGRAENRRVEVIIKPRTVAGSYI